MRLFRGNYQINIKLSENKSMHIVFGFGSIIRLGIQYDSFEPFRNISIDLLFIGLHIFF